jgi:hypothetical protein
MRPYVNYTVARVKRGDATQWRVLAWKSAKEFALFAICPSEEIAEAIAQALRLARHPPSGSSDGEDAGEETFASF